MEFFRRAIIERGEDMEPLRAAFPRFADSLREDTQADRADKSAVDENADEDDSEDE